MRLGDPFGEVRRDMWSSTSSQSVISSGRLIAPAPRRAATSAAGDTPSASAQATRSGSCAFEEAQHRREEVAVLEPLAQSRPGVSPVSASSRCAARFVG